MDEQIFKVKLERFKMKAVWERTIFYAILTFWLGFLWITLDTSTKIGKLPNNFLAWFLVLGIILIGGEYTVNKYLNKEEKQLISEIKSFS